MPPAAVDRGSTRSDSVAAAAQRVTGSAISKGAKGGVVVVATPAAMTDGAILSARERLRLHVQRNLALQESAARTAQVSPHTQGSATAAGSPATQKAPPKSAKKTSSSSSTPPPILQAGSISKASASGLEDLYAPHEDTRLGAADLRSGNSDGYLAPELSLDIGGAIEPSDDAEDASAFETGSARGLADTPPEWAGNSGSSFTVNNTSRETQGDDEWVQELYDMQGMVGEES